MSARVRALLESWTTSPSSLEDLERRLRALDAEQAGLLRRRVGQLERALAQLGKSHCEKHDVLYVRTDENMCPKCWRGE